MKSLTAYDSGKTILVEQCRKISVNEVIETVKPKLKEQLIQMELDANGLEIELTTSKTRFKGNRIWFKCPMCRNRIGVLYQHPLSNVLGCRDCLNLEYKSRRYKGMIEETL